MSANIYSDELIEKCEDDLTHIAEKIQHYKETIRKQQLTLAALLAKKESIELAMSQLKVHAPTRDPVVARYCKTFVQDTMSTTTCLHCGEVETEHPVELVIDKLGHSMSKAHYNKVNS